MASISRSVVCLALTAFAAGPAFGQGRGRPRAGDTLREKVAPWRGDAEVAGKLTDESGKGIADAKVFFFFGNGGFFATTKKNGEFSAKDIKAGEWRVQVEAANFPIWRQSVTLDNKKNTVNIQLKHDNSPELIAAAEELYKAGKLPEARAEYMKVLAAHPELTAINRAIAFTYGREGNHAEALKYLDLAIAANPNDALLLQLAASSATQVGEYPRAVAYLGKIEDDSPNAADVLLNGAIALLNKGRKSEAMSILQRVVKLADPDSPQRAQAKELLGLK